LKNERHRYQFRSGDHVIFDITAATSIGL
jgi:hypothetical protein